MTIDCLAAYGAREKLRAFQYEPAELAPLDVELDITHCGICHSDLHLINNDWGFSTFPLVPGHEIVGTVSALGAAVRNFQRGQRVGVGWQAAACMECEQCRSGYENLCARWVPTCVGRYGGYANRIRVDSRFAFPIPSGYDSAEVAPLLCGGITVFTPLREYGVTPLTRVGVIGVGGLGHLALQFAKAFGCEVTAFSSTPAKESEARKFGAHNFISNSNAEALKKAAQSLDFLLSTVPASLDWDTYLNVLRPKGKLCFVGAPPGPLTVSMFPLIIGQRTICGSNTGGPKAIQEMLGFASRHGIKAQVELMHMSEANAALAKVAENRVRYRMVLVN